MNNMPKTKYGKWSIGLCGLFFLFLVIFFLLVQSGQRGGDKFFSNMWLTTPFLLAGASAIAGMVMGIMAIFKQKEKSWLVYISSFIGFFVTLYLAAEFIFPH